MAFLPLFCRLHAITRTMGLFLPKIINSGQKWTKKSGARLVSIIQFSLKSVLKLGLHWSSNNALHWKKRQFTPLCAPKKSKTQLKTPLRYITQILCSLARFGVVQVHFEAISRPILTQNFPSWLLWYSVGSLLKLKSARNIQQFIYLFNDILLQWFTIQDSWSWNLR